jgi:hypothetical protein
MAQMAEQLGALAHSTSLVAAWLLAYALHSSLLLGLVWLVTPYGVRRLALQEARSEKPDRTPGA